MTSAIVTTVPASDSAVVSAEIRNNFAVAASEITTLQATAAALPTSYQPLDADLTAIAALTSAANKLPYATGAQTWSLADFTAAGRALVDDADASAQRTTLGLAIGTNVQAQDAELQAIAGLTSAADTAPYFTGSGTAALMTVTSFARTLLDDADAAAARTTLGITSSSGLTGFRNRIINGCMRVAQRGTSFTSLASAAYSLDRWLFRNTSAAVVDVTQNSDVPATGGFTHSLRATVTTADASVAAGDLVTMSQRIEGLNCADLLLGTASAVTVTVSFWVRSTVTGTYYVGLTNSAANRSYVGSYTVSVTNTWEQKSVVIALDQSGTWLITNGIGAHLAFQMLCGSTFQTTAGAWQAGEYYGVSGNANALATIGNIFAIAGVQLEVASAATAFERRPFGTELALCQRYYTKTFPLATAPAQNAGQPGSLSAVAASTNTAPGAGMSVSWRFPVEMRASPTVTTYSPTASAADWYNTPSGTNLTATVTNTGTSGTRIQNNAAATDGVLYLIHASAEVEL